MTTPEFKSAPRPGNQHLLYVPGRVLLQSDREMELIEGRLTGISREELVELGPDDAGALGIANGDLVEVATSRHSFQGRVVVREGAHSGTVSSTGLFGQLAVALNSSEEPDPMSKVSRLTITPATVVKSGS